MSIFTRAADRLVAVGERAYYYHCLRRKKPYFGPVMAALQGTPVRHYYMTKLVESECSGRSADRPYRILEIGSWAGGSAITWAEAARKHNRAGGIVVCVDPWRSYFELGTDTAPTYKTMEKAVHDDGIYRLFLHNIRSSGHGSVVLPFRGESAEILPLLAREAFDLIFVDGSHYYSQVLKDLENSGPLVAEGGIICGDDLELQLHESDEAKTRNHLRQDFILDPRTGKNFHPGVTLAVGDYFGKVSSWEGFWAVRRGAGGRWENVTIRGLDSSEALIPQHLESDLFHVLHRSVAGWRDQHRRAHRSAGAAGAEKDA